MTINTIMEAIEFFEKTCGFSIFPNADPDCPDRWRMKKPECNQIHYFGNDQELIDFAVGIKKLLDTELQRKQTAASLNIREYWGIDK